MSVPALSLLVNGLPPVFQFLTARVLFPLILRYRLVVRERVDSADHVNSTFAGKHGRPDLFTGLARVDRKAVGYFRVLYLELDGLARSRV